MTSRYAIDLRSDTVTRPTPAMRRAMAEAEVGDDVYGEDPTVRALEEETASLLGKEAALFVPSGTMANQLGLASHAGPGSEILVEAGAHVLNYEGGAPAALWGIQIRAVAGVQGRLHPAHIREAVRPVDVHVPPLRAVEFENTHNRAGGSVWPPAELAASARAARELNLGIHLDGARLWNAAAAGGDLQDLASAGDTVSVCFSKGLGAPVGSALVSTRERIRDARFRRKRLGGGMRQAGIIAAGALYGLRHNRDRLVDDHRRAASLGKRLREIPGVEVYPVESNIVIVDLAPLGVSQEAAVAAAAEQGLGVIGFGGARVRMATHLEIDDDDIATAAEIFARVLGRLGSAG
jgi:threonine aldolase